jgi:hypothetical protein
LEASIITTTDGTIKIILELHLVIDGTPSRDGLQTQGASTMPPTPSEWQPAQAVVSDGFAPTMVGGVEKSSGQDHADPMNEYVLKAPTKATKKTKEKEKAKEKPGTGGVEEREKSRLALLEFLDGAGRNIGDISALLGLTTKASRMRLYRARELIRGKGPDHNKTYVLTPQGLDELKMLRKKYGAKKGNAKAGKAEKEEEAVVESVEEPASFKAASDNNDSEPQHFSDVTPTEDEEAEPFLQVPALPVDDDEDPNTRAMITRGMFLEAQLLRRFESPRTAATVIAEASKAFEMPVENVQRLLRVLENSEALESYGNGRLVTTSMGAQKLRRLVGELAASGPIGAGAEEE